MTQLIRVSDHVHDRAEKEANEKDMTMKNVVHEWMLMAQFREGDNE